MIYKDTILITGASGKIGSEIFNDLSKKNYNVIATYFKKKIKTNSSKKNVIIKKSLVYEDDCSKTGEFNNYTLIYNIGTKKNYLSPNILAL